MQSQRFLILGAARSGIAAARLLQSNGIPVTVADSKSAAEAGVTAAELAEAGIAAAWGDDAILAAMSGCTVMVKSPGIPQDNVIVKAARDSGLRVISEIELASAFVPEGARTIAITGTNGKTTVTAWLAHTLNQCGFNAITAGNIGDAWCNRLLTPSVDSANTIYVVEVSSFQLEDIEDFHPHVALLTNISPDHMDRYDDKMDLYVAAKANILRNMTSADIFIYNAGDESSEPVAGLSRARNLGFMASETSPSAPLGIYAGTRDSNIWLNDFAQSSDEFAGDDLMPLADLPIPGLHNLENALAVILACRAVGAEPSRIVSGLKSFTGVEHRIELCHTRADGVRFYNDSKATNLDAMKRAVVAFDQPIVLIAGGRDAHSDYLSIAHLIKKHVSHLVTLGEAAPLIEEAWGPIVPTRRAATMQEAVAIANDLATPGSVVVFSPACKSFDMYRNFEERGEDFKAQVGLLG